MNILRTLFKIVYLSFTYLIGGIDGTYYRIMRGNYFADIGLFNYAIRDLNIAHKNSEDPNVEAALGWCYAQINKLDISLDYYRKANSKSKDPEIVLGLAYAEYYNGNIAASKALVEKLSLAHKDNSNLLVGILKFHEETAKWDDLKSNGVRLD